MASGQLQKPTKETSSHNHEDKKLSYKISEMTAWGSRVLGHNKQQEHQTMTKHCATCQCPPSKKGMKSECTETDKKESSLTIKDKKSGANKEKDAHASTVNKDGKHITCFEVKKKEKQQITNSGKASTEMKKKDKKEHVGKSNITNVCNNMTKKDSKEEAGNHFFSSVADHWKEKITKKKGKDGKSKDSSSSGESEVEISYEK